MILALGISQVAPSCMIVAWAAQSQNPEVSRYIRRAGSKLLEKGPVEVNKIRVRCGLQAAACTPQHYTQGNQVNAAIIQAHLSAQFVNNTSPNNTDLDVSA